MYIFSSRKRELKGFSLIELVVVVAVLSILSAIAIPSFNCFTRKSKAVAALSAIKQIQNECEVTALTSPDGYSYYTATNIDSYLNINTYSSETNNQNQISCGAGSIELVPNSSNTNLLPTFKYNNQTKLLSFVFKGISGSNFSKCISLVCDSNSSNYINNNNQLITSNRNSLLSAIQQNADLIMPNSFSERGCSAYVLVKGSTWDQAQSNAQALGGNLTTPNNKEENQFIIDQYTEMLESEDTNWNNGVRSGAWIGLNSDSEGNLSFADGQKLDVGYDSPFGSAQNFHPDEYKNQGVRSGYHLLMKDPSGHAQGHGGLNTWWREPVTGSSYYNNDDDAYWGYNYGIAEVPICNES